MNAAERLDEIEARVAAVEPGPWTVEHGALGGAVWVNTPAYPHTIAMHGFPDEAEFIAHARTDVPALVSALRAVLAFADGCDVVAAATRSQSDDTRAAHGAIAYDLRGIVTEALGGTP